MPVWVTQMTENLLRRQCLGSKAYIGQMRKGQKTRPRLSACTESVYISAAGAQRAHMSSGVTLCVLQPQPQDLPFLSLAYVSCRNRFPDPSCCLWSLQKLKGSGGFVHILALTGRPGKECQHQLTCPLLWTAVETVSERGGVRLAASIEQ